MIRTIQQTIRRTVRSRESPAALDFFMGKCYIPDMKKQMEKKARPPAGAAADWTIPQNWLHYTAQDHATWDRLFGRQSALLPGCASEAYLRGLDMLRLSKPGIPAFEVLSERLIRVTGCRVGELGRAVGWEKGWHY